MGRLRGDRSENNTSNSSAAKFLHVFQRSNTSTKFNENIDRLNDFFNHSAIRRLSTVECAIEIDNVNQLCTGRRKLLRHRKRILIVNSHVRLPPLPQPHALAVLKIYRGYYDHF